eukprot:gnl/MRDRNA2_/MRDRNA2_31085_c0_seq2.p1 gnl/MRDRNA2_/MRDRNA2_31085_c0~~gnl/MRDRNA2_/MRDRNA2_31085_c0_seq2.p1  ORF type:complete len:242 (+),score=33.45 gnl/MRDRNA2_/MRDRNA2_31085_c0_seq2:307-1032(+)
MVKSPFLDSLEWWCALRCDQMYSTCGTEGAICRDIYIHGSLIDHICVWPPDAIEPGLEVINNETARVDAVLRAIADLPGTEVEAFKRLVETNRKRREEMLAELDKKFPLEDFEFRPEVEEEDPKSKEKGLGGKVYKSGGGRRRHRIMDYRGPGWQQRLEPFSLDSEDTFSVKSKYSQKGKPGRPPGSRLLVQSRISSEMLYVIFICNFLGAGALACYVMSWMVQRRWHSSNSLLAVYRIPE